jgi:hypothetical protein
MKWNRLPVVMPRLSRVSTSFSRALSKSVDGRTSPVMTPNNWAVLEKPIAPFLESYGLRCPAPDRAHDEGVTPHESDPGDGTAMDSRR